MKHVKIQDWSDFEKSLRIELDRIFHVGLVTARNFQLLTFAEDCTETNRLQIVLSTGTDRDAESSFWNASGFDHEHDLRPTGKRPDEIIYAFTIDLSQTPYLVLHDKEPLAFDITKNLSEIDGIIIYDTSKLKRVSKNEYWFTTSPLSAALFVFTIADAEE